ncbi:sugar phosphate isomerase/epimerase [Lentibacter algarum]|uniref:sugar phosphate isomerase/epimerase family protein n=1 Tax=Lentibacter algarum TaxID=576131 RepID=UPI001C072B53|nr:sugar phosphate isomerase/epimerase family protein [Lentibacter algarum]MBU2980202.1 sugar phosphate isomerase/epimerase [Lentibacter algarum]
MSNVNKTFGINTYSYTLDYTAADCLRHLADKGFDSFELMMYPGHLWPHKMSKDELSDLKSVIEKNDLRIVSVNMPNIDINVAGASPEMRDYTLGLLSQFMEFTGEIGASGMIVGPGKSNPLFAPTREELIGHTFAALDRLSPVAEKAGVTILMENMPFAYMPAVKDLMKMLADYGNDDIGVIYDVANGHFIGMDPCEELRMAADRLKLVHFSDTNQKVYKHDAVGMGDVPFATVPPVLAEIGYREKPMLEIIAPNPDAGLLDSCAQLYEMGYRSAI